jgi:hypothetical protein
LKPLGRTPSARLKPLLNTIKSCGLPLRLNLPEQGICSAEFNKSKRDAQQRILQEPSRDFDRRIQQEQA